MIRYRLGTYLNEIHICDVMPSKVTNCENDCADVLGHSEKKIG